MINANDANQLASHLEVLDNVELDEGLDYETIGKIVIASFLRDQDREISSQQPDDKGHIKLEANLRQSMKMHVEANQRRRPCCVCFEEPNGIVVCRGRCCDFP